MVKGEVMILPLLLIPILFGLALFGIGYLNERQARAMSKDKWWNDENLPD